MPQTQHQAQRGKTVGAPSGPTYYMPGTSAQAAARPGQYTRQKPRQQPWSITGPGKDGAAAKDPLDSSLNQSFHASTDKFGSTARSGAQFGAGRFGA